MYVKLKLTVNQTLLTRWREAPRRARLLFRSKLQTVLKPELQDKVDMLMRPGPGPSLFGIQFNTEKSKRYWFLLIRANPDMTTGGGKAHAKGGHYIRTFIIEEGFRVFVSDRLRGDLITIKNIQEAAKSNPRDLVPRLRASYVYGPRLVLGHIASGWPDSADIAKQLLLEYAVERCKELFAESLRSALKGQG